MNTYHSSFIILCCLAGRPGTKYTDPMTTIEQTVDIPPSRRVYFDVPDRVPLGKARITVQIDEPAPCERDETEYLLASAANRERLLKAVDDIETGRNLITFDTLEDAITQARG
jgi:hypothetical protein